MADLFKPYYIEQARKLATLGATDREVAEFFEVAEGTVTRWRHAHPDFGRALKLGKDAADERVEQSLYRRATGYSYDAVKIFQYQGQPVKVPYEELCATLSAACSSESVTAVHEAPRVEKFEAPPTLLAECPRAREGAPDPTTATFLDAARYIVALAARNDACADQVEGLRMLLAP